MVRTLPFHGNNTGSNPVKNIIEYVPKDNFIFFYFKQNMLVQFKKIKNLTFGSCRFRTILISNADL